MKKIIFLPDLKVTKHVGPRAPSVAIQQMRWGDDQMTSVELLRQQCRRVYLALPHHFETGVESGFFV